ncbi:MAG TPA: hypothetical protein VFZ91_09415 [Allosphingosinicella sp.]
MDARAWLAVVAVIRAAVESAKSPVAYLKVPEAVPVDRFKALAGFDTTPEGVAALFSLAWLVNRRIELPFLGDPGPMPLWTLVHDILAHGEPGDREPPAADAAAWRAARRLLYVEDEAGTARPTPLHLAYWQSRDEWFRRRQEIASRRMEGALLAPDGEARAANALLVERLERELANFELGWEVEGRRRDIEDAAATIEAFQARSPRRQWARWKEMLAPFVDAGGQGERIDVLSEVRFGATAIAPAGVEESLTSWISVSLAGAEIDRLVDGLPAALKTPLNPGGGPLGLDRLAFAYRTVAVTRPWPAREVLESNAWRLPDRDRTISDGADPAAGEYPYVATGLVLVRHVKASFRPAPPPPPAAIFHPGLFVVANILSPPPPAPRPVKRFASPRFAAARPVRPAAATPHSMVLLQEATLVRRGVPLEPARAAADVPQPAPPPPAPPEVDPDEPILICALVCDAVPLCPNPDPELFRDRPALAATA